MSDFYLIKNKDTGYGDWGGILWDGFAPEDEDTGLRYIERVGPFVPKMYVVAGIIVIKNEIAPLITKSDLRGITIGEEIERRKIVPLDWSKWGDDYEKQVERFYEPEDIINKGIHSAEIAAEIGPLRELKVQPSLKTISTDEKNPQHEYGLMRVCLSSWNGSDITRGENYGGFFVTDTAKKWIEENCGDIFDYYFIESVVE